MALTFEWDARKATRNLATHNVSFDEAITIFADPLARLEDEMIGIQFLSRDSYY